MNGKVYKRSWWLENGQLVTTVVGGACGFIVAILIYPHIIVHRPDYGLTLFSGSMLGAIVGSLMPPTDDGPI